MKNEFVYQTTMVVLNEIYLQAKDARFSFDKLQTHFGKAFQSLTPAMQEKLSGFQSVAGMDLYSDELDSILMLAEQKGILYAAGANRNRFQVTSRIVNEVKEWEVSPVSAAFAKSVLKELKKHDLSKSF